jgi:hypothetical protein
MLCQVGQRPRETSNAGITKITQANEMNGKIITSDDLERCSHDWCDYKGEGTGMKIHLSRFHSPEKDKKRLESRLARIDAQIKRNEEKRDALLQERAKTAEWLDNP